MGYFLLIYQEKKMEIAEKKMKGNIFNRTDNAIKKSQHILTNTHKLIINHDHNEFKFLCLNCNSVVVTSKDNLGQPVPCTICDKYNIAPTELLSPNTIIDDFIIEKEISRGGNGVVYQAHQRSLDRECVLKTLNKQATDSRLLLTEARLTAKLTHHNIVQCYAVNKYDNFYYYVMEYIKGPSLKTVIEEENKLDYRRALNIIIQITSALNYAWQHCQLIHHDINPDNIMLEADDTAKLCDLGLAKISNAGAQQEDNDLFLGTPEFTSPENVIGEEVSFKGDMYSLGVVFYLMVTGNMPHNDDDRIALMKKHITDTPINPRAYTADLPDDLIRIIDKMMSKDPQKRYKTYDILLDAMIELQFKCNKKDLNKVDSLTSKLMRSHLTSSSVTHTPIISREHDTKTKKFKFNGLGYLSFFKIMLAITSIIVVAIILFYCLKKAPIDQQSPPDKTTASDNIFNLSLTKDQLFFYS